MPALAASWRRRRSAAWAPWWRRSGIPKDSCSPSSFRQSASPQDNQSDWSPRLRSSAKLARLHLDRVDAQDADVAAASSHTIGFRVTRSGMRDRTSVVEGKSETVWVEL